MIFLCEDSKKIQDVIARNFGLTCIRNTIELYFLSYGVSFDFAQFYIQYSEISNTDTALVCRYNQTVYCIADSNCDYTELASFLCGFSDVTLICDDSLPTLTDFEDSRKIGAVMSKKGEVQSVHNPCVGTCNEPKLICNLVSEDMSEEKKIDFFLNTAHQLRHGFLSVFAYLEASSPVSVVSLYENDGEYAVIPFVYTGKYFRGNGYSQQVLHALCSNPQVTYELLCEEHNIKFYEKCGFAHVSDWVKYSL